MRTSIDLPDDLAIEAKKLAAELKIPLRALIEQGLRARLSRRNTPEAPSKKRIEWVTVDGDLAEDLNLESREQMYDWLGQNDT
jgi:hypothetical protein